MEKVFCVIPCSKAQSPKWWVPVLSECVKWHLQGIEFCGLCAPTGAMTDTARNTGMTHFFDSDADWVWQADDDTIPPLNVVRRLLALRAPYASGVYFSRADIKKGEIPVPLAYTRTPNSLYLPGDRYYPGEIKTMDATGMGCSLIHRSVFEAVMEHYTLIASPVGPIRPVTDEQVSLWEPLGWRVYDPAKADGPVNYPFYLWEAGRTEDMFFAELVNPLGIYPVVDYGIRCGHISEYQITEEDFLRMARPLVLYDTDDSTSHLSTLGEQERD